MRGTDLSRLVQYEIQMRVIEIFQGGLIKLSTRIVGDGYVEEVDGCRIFRGGQNADMTKDHYWFGVLNQVW